MVTASSVATGTYDLTETDVAGDGHDTSDYSASAWSCVKTGTATSVPAPSSAVTLGFGDDVTCTVTNTQNGHWKIAKSADKADLATYKPGETIHYTLTATHTSGVAPTGVVVHDDLTELLKYATAPASWPAGISGPDAGDVITWDVGTLATTKSISFDFVVKASAVGVTITNLATSPGSDNCPEAAGPDSVLAAAVAAAAPDCGTIHYTPKWELAKSSVPGDGVVQPASSITYTLSVKNVSNANVEGMTVTDDISGLAGKIDPAFYATFPHDGLTLSADHSTITWAVPTILAGGADATVSYTVTVKSDAWDVTLKNHATPVDVTGSCPGANHCITTHTTPKQPLLTLVKDVDNGISTPVAKTAWDLSADPTVGVPVHALGGFGPQGVDPDTYALSEELVAAGVDPADWTASAWTCTNHGLPVSLTQRHQRHPGPERRRDLHDREHPRGRVDGRQVQHHHGAVPPGRHHHLHPEGHAHRGRQPDARGPARRPDGGDGAREHVQPRSAVRRDRRTDPALR